MIIFNMNYSDEKKKEDKECLDLLIHNANTIPDEDNTFKKRFENGEKIRI